MKRLPGFAFVVALTGIVTAPGGAVTMIAMLIAGPIVQTFVTRGTQIAHLDLAAHVTPYNPAFQPMLSGGSRYDPAMLDPTITQQAQMIACLNDFKMMFVATLLAIPLLVLIRPRSGGASAVDGSHAAMD